MPYISFALLRVRDPEANKIDLMSLFLRVTFTSAPSGYEWQYGQENVFTDRKEGGKSVSALCRLM